LTRAHPARVPAMPQNPPPVFERFGMKTFQCVVCGFVYDEAAGQPADGIAPGTLWADVPDSWTCPDCGVGKSDFEMIEI